MTKEKEIHLFVRKIKDIALQFKTEGKNFDEFIEFANIRFGNQTTIKHSEFNWLIQLAASDANLD